MGDMLGHLDKALYGTRDAPHAWLQELSGTLLAAGFVEIRIVPGVHWCEELEVGMVVHVDDLSCSGTEFSQKESQRHVDVRSKRRYHDGRVRRVALLRARHREEAGELPLRGGPGTSAHLVRRVRVVRLQWGEYAHCRGEECDHRLA